ncbi:MAG: nucleoside triphosphate pyrophosphohydrolase, partial [Candidatus Wallbacteria bacterium]|nr:nucleoside triphosphate pyrophosphohydrolase [Candidatus Wallbacteria bacterium]
LEEAHGVIEAIDKDAPEEHCEELGDLLLQIVFQAQIASEKKQFDFQNVVNGISGKLIRRHPHVFRDMKLNTSDDVLREWENIKKEEGKSGIFEGIPKSLPALLMAEKYQKRARKIGLDFGSVREVLSKVVEEADELADNIGADRDSMEEEYGDLLFSVVNLGRLLKLSAETALLRSSAKFRARVVDIEALLADHPERDVIINNPERLDALWEKAKDKRREVRVK